MTLTMEINTSARKLSRVLHILLITCLPFNSIQTDTLQEPGTHIHEETPDTNATNLERMIAEHRTMCKVDKSCGTFHVSSDGHCYCDRCSCEPDCVMKDNCCPDVVKDFWTIPTPELKYQCVPLTYRFHENVPYNLMIGSCPKASTDVDNVDKCENRQGRADLSYAMPVDDTTTKITYANKYCALCHSIPLTNISIWTAHVKCTTRVFTPKTEKTILADINATNDCDLSFNPIKNHYTKFCKNVISSCDKTREWDRFTEQACKLYSSPYLGKYRNPFCARCNGYNVTRHKRSSTNCGILIPPWAPFSALLDFRPEQDVDELQPASKCADDELYDSYANLCRDLLCEAGMRVRNGTCEPVYKEIDGVCYQLTIQMAPIANGTEQAGDESTDEGVLSTEIPQKSPAMRVNNTTDPQAMAKAFENQLLSVADSHSAERYLRKLTFYKTNPIHTGVVSSVMIYADVFYSIEFSINVKELLKEMNVLYNNNNVSFTNGSSISYFKVTLVRLQKASMVDGVISPLTNEVMVPFYMHSYRPSDEIQCLGDEITITDFYFNPFVRLSNDSYTWTINSSGVIIYELELYLDNAMFRESKTNSTIFVSADPFQIALEQKRMEGESSDVPRFSAIEGIVTLILVCLSVMCLLLTLLTYSIFPVLRSQPGINNMILCVCLTFGYLFFTFGTTRTELDYGCKILGGLVHFSWVFVFFWMNICSYHMFRVFGSFNQIKAPASKLKLTIYYLLYSFFSTSAIITINIIVTYYTCNGASSGYGPDKTGLCYIYEPMMTLYTVAIPAIGLVAANVTMFIVVVYRVQQVTDITKHVQNEKNYFSVYIRLSTITGMAWIVAIPMMLLRLAVFNYIFVILTCSQGVYLMVAFMCNKKVKKLYLEKVYPSKVPRRSIYLTETQTYDDANNHSSKTSTKVTNSL